MHIINTVVSSPSVVINITFVAISPNTSIVFVVTEVMYPREFSLKYPIGKYLRCSAISILLLAAVSYPASVCNIVDLLLSKVTPTILTIIIPKDVRQVLSVTLFSITALIIT